MSVDFAPQHASGFDSQGSVTADKLYDRETVRRKRVISSGEGVVARGTLLGEVAAGTATVTAKGGNTGNPTATAAVAGDVAPGRYSLVFTAATTWNLLAPSGALVKSGVNGAASTAPLNITTTAGGTAAVAGDTLYVDVVRTAGEWRKSTLTATDGSQTPKAVLLDGVDATSADAEGVIAVAGHFAKAGVILGEGHTLASVEDGLFARGIYLDHIIGA